MLLYQVILPFVAFAGGAFGNYDVTFNGDDSGELTRIPVDDAKYADLCDGIDQGAFCLHMTKGKVSDIQVVKLINDAEGKDVNFGTVFAKSNDQDFGVLINDKIRVFTLYLKGSNVFLHYEDPEAKETKMYDVWKHGLRDNDYNVVIKNEQDQVIAVDRKPGSDPKRWVHVEVTN